MFVLLENNIITTNLLRIILFISFWSVFNPEETEKIDQSNLEAVNLLSKDLSLAFDLASKNYENANDINYKEGMAKAKFIIAYVHDENKIYDRALISYLESVSLNPDNSVQVSKIYLSVGRIFKVYGNYKEAEYYYNLSLDRANKNLKAGILYNLGNLKQKEGELEASMKYYIRGVKQCEITDDHLRLAKIFTQMGVVLQKIGEYDQAREYLFQVVNHEKLNIYKKYYGYALHNIAFGYSKEEKYNKAIEYYNKSLIEKSGHNQYLTLLEIARVYQEQGNIERSEYYFFQALPHLSSKDNEPQYFSIYKSLAKLYESSNDLSKSNQFHKLYTSALEIHMQEKDDLIDIQEKNHVKWVADNYEKQQYIKSARKNHILEVTVLVLSAVILLIVMLFIVNRRIKKKKLNIKAHLDKFESELLDL